MRAEQAFNYKARAHHYLSNVSVRCLGIDCECRLQQYKSEHCPDLSVERLFVTSL